MEFREYYRSRFLSEYRFFFIRVPKTASTTVIACLENSGVKIRHLDNKFDGAASPIPATVNLPQEYSTYKVAAGHICYGDVLRSLGGMRPIFLAQVREPIRRAISLYHQAVSEQEHPCHQDVNGRTLAQSLELEGKFYEWVYNAQCRFISSGHFFESTKTIMNKEYMMVLKHVHGNTLGMAVAACLGAAPARFELEMNARETVRQPVEVQPDYEQAIKILRWITAEDRKLCEYVGECFISPRTRELLEGDVLTRKALGALWT
jgi:hypothetical protein